MSKRTRRPAPATGATQPTVTVCRGCCCGTPKVPGLDHSAQLRDLRQALDGTATVRVTDCLDACERANVIVVQPSADGRQNGGRPVWLGLVNDPDAVPGITTWLKGGGPGLSDPPGILDLYAFRPSRAFKRNSTMHDPDARPVCRPSSANRLGGHPMNPDLPERRGSADPIRSADDRCRV